MCVLVGTPRFQRQFYGAQNGVFVVMQNQGQDIDHFSVTAFLA